KLIRVAYQIEEDNGNGLKRFVARSLENAIINRNQVFFKSIYKLNGNDRRVCEDFSYKKLQDLNELINLDIDKNQSEVEPSSKQKTNFTFDLMTFDEKNTGISWFVPKYIKEGLEWLAMNEHLGKERE